jgi:hypothetical protein
MLGGKLNGISSQGGIAGALLKLQEMLWVEF